MVSIDISTVSIATEQFWTNFPLLSPSVSIIVGISLVRWTSLLALTTNKQIKYLHNPALNSLAGCVTVFCTPSTAPAWCPWCRRPGGGSSCPARWPAPRPAPPPPQPAAAPGTCSATSQGYRGTGGTGVHRYNEVGAPLEQVPHTRPHKGGSLIL